MRAAALAIALAACGGGGGGARTDGVTVPADTRGPGLTLTLPALDGGELDLATLRGKLVVLHVFTTWSLAAQAELDALAGADAADDVVVVGIALDDEGRALVAPWRKGANVRYLITLADDAIRDGSSALGPLTVVPTTFVLDDAGRVRAKAERALAPGELDALLADARN